MNQLVLRGGTVVDGTGAPGVRVDLAVTDGVVTEIGSGLRGVQEWDVDGLVVSPGFVDVHTHYDAQVLWDPHLTPSCWHGVTTVVAGNCGFSLAPCRPSERALIAETLEHVEAMTLEALHAGIDWNFETFPEFLSAVAARGTALNYAQFVGHTAVRLFVMGSAAYERAATPAEIAAMQAVLRAALDAGAVGFSSSLSPAHTGAAGLPVPSRWAEPDELWGLFDALRDSGRGVLQFIPGDQLTLEELLDAAPRLGRPIIFSEVLTRADGEHWRRLDSLSAARAKGSTDVYGLMAVHPIVFQFTLEDPSPFNVLDEFAALLAGSREERLRAYADESFRRRVEPGLAQLDRWSKMTFDETGDDAARGRGVLDVAAERGVEPFDVVADVALADDLGTRMRVVLVNDDRDAIDQLLNRDGLLVGLSDAGAHATQLCDAGFAAKLLGEFVRDRGALTLEEAVHKLTGQPAAIFGLHDRGVLRPGVPADVTVFDPAMIAPGPLRRVWDFPADSDRLIADRPTGIEHVLVNGTPIRHNGEPVAAGLAAKPGRLLPT